MSHGKGERLTKAHLFWLRHIDRHGDLMTFVQGDDSALGWLMSSVPGQARGRATCCG